VEKRRLLIFGLRARRNPEHPPNAPRSILDAKSSWRLIDELEHVVSQGLLATLESQKVFRWDQVSLPSALSKALATTECLRNQLSIDRGCVIDKLVGLSSQPSTNHCLEAYKQIQTICKGISKQFCCALIMRHQAQQSQVPARSIVIKSVDDRLVVHWLDEQERAVHQEELRDLMNRYLQRPLRDLDRQIKKLETSHHELQDTLGSFAKALPSQLSYIARVSMRVQRGGVCLCRGKTSKGIPIDIWLHVGRNHYGPGMCSILSIERAHDEFVLEAVDGKLYYFPPTLLCARLHFDYSGMHILHPVVRQPAGGYLWNHPYSGSLSDGPNYHSMASPDKETLLGEPSVWAFKTFPQLHQRTKKAMENDLCLDQQSHTIGKINGSLRSALETKNGIQVLYSILELQDVVRHGICRAHQLNESPPRAKLDQEQMPYPILGGTVLPQALRVFPYDPCINNPSSGRRTRLKCRRSASALERDVLFF